MTEISVDFSSNQALSNYISSSTFRNVYEIEFDGRDDKVTLHLDKSQMRKLIQTFIDEELIILDEESQEIVSDV